MKTSPRHISALLTLGAFFGLANAAEKSAGDASTKAQSELRVLAGPAPEAPVFRKHAQPVEKEIVPFLGVEISPASETLAAQLDLPKGAGLVVNTVVPDSAAASVLRPHDILLKLDDQLLIEQRQLAVLIRQRKEGDEVTLTFVRGGKSQTAKAKLRTHEVPKTSAVFQAPLAGAPGYGRLTLAGPARRFDVMEPANAPRNEQEVDHLLRLIQRGHGAPDSLAGRFPQATRIFIDREHGPGFRAMTVSPGNSNLVFSDDEGSLELTITNGKKTLLAKNAKGEELFAGPVTTPAERAAMPAAVRARLEQLEGMQDVTFKTDEQFRGAEAKIVRPPGRAISLPPEMRAPGRAPHRPVF